MPIKVSDDTLEWRKWKFCSSQKPVLSNTSILGSNQRYGKSKEEQVFVPIVDPGCKSIGHV